MAIMDCIQLFGDEYHAESITMQPENMNDIVVQLPADRFDGKSEEYQLGEMLRMKTVLTSRLGKLGFKGHVEFSGVRLTVSW